MPLKTEADYVRLAAHLVAIDPIVEPFAALHGYMVMQWPLGGRYPNRKMHRQDGLVWRCIQITMNEWPNGERYDEFFPEIPYNVFGAAWVDDFDCGLRWSGPHLTTRGIPFCELVTTLPIYLQHMESYLKTLKEDSIRAFGHASPVARPPE